MRQRLVGVRSSSIFLSPTYLKMRLMHCAYTKHSASSCSLICARTGSARHRRVLARDASSSGLVPHLKRLILQISARRDHGPPFVKTMQTCARTLLGCLRPEEGRTYNSLTSFYPSLNSGAGTFWRSHLHRYLRTLFRPIGNETSRGRLSFFHELLN